MNNKKLIIYGVVLLVISLGLLRAYYRITDDFRLANISYDFPYNPNWAISPLSAEMQKKIDAILSQQFTYIDKGAQSYAFGSEDQQYVLKFFKFKHIKPVWFFNLLPPVSFVETYRQRVMARKQKKFNSVFVGYKLAYDVHREESGLLYIQLNPIPKGAQSPRLVNLIDKIGLKRTVDLNDVVFILQERVRTLRSVLRELLANDDVAMATQRIRQIFDLYLSEYNKGIHDRDNGVMHNTGFAGDMAVHLDTGKMARDPELANQSIKIRNLRYIAGKIEMWIQAEYPQHYAEILSDIKLRFKELFGEEVEFRETSEVMAVRLKYQ